jgi:hypothetical protein
MTDESGHVDGLAEQFEDVVVVRRGHEDVLATTDGRKEGDFVARTEGSIPGSEFLIEGSDDGGTEPCELGVSCGVEGEELLDGGGGVEVEGFFGVAGQIFETAKEEDFDANGLGDGSHNWIVAEE